MHRLLHHPDIPYFFGYKTGFFSFQNHPKDLDPSCKMDLDRWECLGRVKLVLLQNFIGLIKLFEVILEGQNPPPPYSRINTVTEILLKKMSNSRHPSVAKYVRHRADLTLALFNRA